MAQSIFLTEFIQEIVRTSGRDTASVSTELLDAARRALHAVFGELETEVEVVIADAHGEVRFNQILMVVERPSAVGEVAVADVRALGSEFADAKAGDRVFLPLLYNANPSNRAVIERFAGLDLPLPIHHAGLWDALNEELNAALLQYFPGPTFPPGTVGELLASGGGWTRGLCATSGQIEVEIPRAFFKFWRLHVTSGWVDYGFETVVRRDGVEIFRGDLQTRYGRLEGGGSAEVLVVEDNEGTVRAWAALPTSDCAREQLVGVLQRVADSVAGGEGLNGRTRCHEVLTAAIEPPRSDGLWAWMNEHLPAEIVGHSHGVEIDGATVVFRVTEVYLPSASLNQDASMSLAIEVDGVADKPTGWLLLGGARPEVLQLRGPTADEADALLQIVARFRDWLDEHLTHHARTSGIEHAHDFFGLTGHFPLPDLLATRITQGPPGPVPAPLPQAPKLVEKEGDGAHTIASFVVDGWTIVLKDDLKDGPHGSHCAIRLITPDGKDLAVLTVDAWNPPAREVVDGDAFALRRFLQWLRAGIGEGDHDRTLTFNTRDDDVDDDEGDYDYDDDAPIDILLSDWLLFGLLDTGDRHLVDWRVQWHVAPCSRGIKEFAAIYGYTGEYLARLAEHDIPAWRRFLHEQVYR